MALNIPALLSMILFYLITLVTGVWAAWKSKKLEKNGNQTEMTIIGGRSMNMFLGIFTTTATWLGGGYINGTAEIVYIPGRGLVWLQAPLGFALALSLGSLFFITPMRSKKYLTMMDPLQEAYGNTMTILLFIPALIGDMFWFAAILASLASSVSVIMDIQNYLSIIISACIVITYTLFGGLYSVAYTDIMQLLFIIFGLCICVPFAMMNPASQSISLTAVQGVFQAPWLGKLDIQYVGVWIDDMLYMSLGNIPWQIYFQRVLSASSTTQAKVTSYLAAILCLVLAIPSVLIGAVASSTDWNQTTYGLPSPYERGDASMILPIVMQHLCPMLVSVAGLGAITAAVMSSADSALLSSSSLFCHNLYKKIFRKKEVVSRELFDGDVDLLADTLGKIDNIGVLLHILQASRISSLPDLSFSPLLGGIQKMTVMPTLFPSFPLSGATDLLDNRVTALLESISPFTFWPFIITSVINGCFISVNLQDCTAWAHPDLGIGLPYVPSLRTGNTSPYASDKEEMVVMRTSTFVLGSVAAGLAFLSNSIYDLWFICGELVYAIVLPQFVCALFIPKTNTYGSAASFLFGLLLRILGGDEVLKIPPVIHYPGCTLINGVYVQLFPFKTFTMLLSLATLVIVSYLTEFLFKTSILPKHWDICNVLKVEDTTLRPTTEPEELRNLDHNFHQTDC
ncbi:high affinity choline transporter 1-like [Discoglossus pictus]